MRKTLQIEKTIYTIADLILPDAPQVALAGRSNVGKSSLVNRLAGRKQLAKTSSTPGKTQSINLYSVAPGAYYLVDLPGYGYAKYSKTERAKWAKLIEKYLTGNRLLHAVAVLLDCRLTPQASDLDMVAWLRAESIPMIGVLTKADKCTQRERQAQKALWTPLLAGAAPVLFSSVTGMGYDDLWARFDAAVGYAPDAEGGPEAAQPTSDDTEPPA
ncbi:ribosome biogenesis GTP-binding protein YihA/YsxC [Fundidesulfovibrio soli]|uniref:ribosome biogenesis GTP-binding protein YihA/YsxC n=1 Tax=Fundidesulfovibrio soli TaxID=2922716 RepID=UPI001FB000E0|nr:ribosome biogenesis GTP-binding protein YihA/YsxC [Fundidesulfovibrio soli]